MIFITPHCYQMLLRCEVIAPRFLNWPECSSHLNIFTQLSFLGVIEANAAFLLEGTFQVTQQMFMNL